MAIPRSTSPRPSTKTSPQRLDWSDPSAVAAWARDVYTQARDALAAGEDATRAPGKRELGRRAARRIIRQADRKIAGAFRFAGLDAATGRAP